jgi:hypothetical protein
MVVIPQILRQARLSGSDRHITALSSNVTVKSQSILPQAEVETTHATTPDNTVLDDIHGALAAKGVLPREHLLDGGYPSAEQLVSIQSEHGIDDVWAATACTAGVPEAGPRIVGVQEVNVTLHTNDKAPLLALSSLIKSPIVSKIMLPAAYHYQAIPMVTVVYQPLAQAGAENLDTNWASVAHLDNDRRSKHQCHQQATVPPFQPIHPGMDHLAQALDDRYSGLM